MNYVSSSGFKASHRVPQQHWRHRDATQRGWTCSDENRYHLKDAKDCGRTTVCTAKKKKQCTDAATKSQLYVSEVQLSLKCIFGVSFWGGGGVVVVLLLLEKSAITVMWWVFTHKFVYIIRIKWTTEDTLSIMLWILVHPVLQRWNAALQNLIMHLTLTCKPLFWNTYLLVFFLSSFVWRINSFF